MESLTASSWPFFLVQMYFPLLAFSATLWPSHSTENMLVADLHITGHFCNALIENNFGL